MTLWILSIPSKVIYLMDGQIAHYQQGNMRIFSMDNKTIEPEYTKLTMKNEEAEKGVFEHFMLKEIYEQPKAIENALRGRVKKDIDTVHIDTITTHIRWIKDIKRIVITACGTSYHSGLLGKYFMEEMLDLPVDVEYSSEFRYRKRALGHDTLVIAISQSVRGNRRYPGGNASS